MTYSVEILVGPKEGIRSPEADTIKKALEESLDFEGINKFDIRRFLCYKTQAETKKLAREGAEKLCRMYFANLSVNEKYEIVSIKEIEK